MENKKKTLPFSSNKRTATANSLRTQNPAKLESEDTLVEIKLKSNKAKPNKPKTNNTAQMPHKATISILKESTVANTANSKLTTEELDTVLQATDLPFKPRSRPLVCHSPPDTPKTSAATIILNKPQSNTLRHRSLGSTTIPASNSINQRVDTTKKQVDTPKPQVNPPKLSPVVAPPTEVPKKTLVIDLTSLPEKNIPTPLPPTPQLEAASIKQLSPARTTVNCHEAAAAQPCTALPTHCSPDLVLYNPNEDWQQHLHTSQLRQNSRAATIAAAAGAAAVAAQVRRDAFDAITRKQQQQQQQQYHQPRIGEATSVGTNKPHCDQRRSIRNVNLLSSALSIIREMDPAYLEKLCYAIHDQVSKQEPMDKP
ncbi:hypothetical protein KR044_007157 [Drosophila immigrans]|nr:hypothetical protein KR044_007157 [Drosophila immigrans]